MAAPPGATLSHSMSVIPSGPHTSIGIPLSRRSDYGMLSSEKDPSPSHIPIPGVDRHKEGIQRADIAELDSPVLIVTGTLLTHSAQISKYTPHIPPRAQGTETTQLSPPVNNASSGTVRTHSGKTKDTIVTTTVQTASKAETRIPLPSKQIGDNSGRVRSPRKELGGFPRNSDIEMNRLSMLSRPADIKKETSGHHSPPKQSLKQDVLFSPGSAIEHTHKLAKSAHTTEQMLTFKAPAYGVLKETETIFLEDADSAATARCEMECKDATVLSHTIKSTNSVSTRKNPTDFSVEIESSYTDAQVQGSIVSEHSVGSQKSVPQNFEPPSGSTSLLAASIDTAMIASLPKLDQQSPSEVPIERHGSPSMQQLPHQTPIMKAEVAQLRSRLRAAQIENESLGSQLKQTQAKAWSISKRRKAERAIGRVKYQENIVEDRQQKCIQLNKAHAEELSTVKKEMRQKFDDERARLLNQILELTRMRKQAGAEVYMLKGLLTEAKHLASTSTNNLERTEAKHLAEIQKLKAKHEEKIKELKKKLRDMNDSRDCYIKRLHQDSIDSASSGQPLKMTRVVSLKKAPCKVCSRTKDQHHKIVHVVSARYLNDTVASTKKKCAVIKCHTIANPQALDVTDGHESHHLFSEGNHAEISYILAPAAHCVEGRRGMGRPCSGGETSLHRATDKI